MLTAEAEKKVKELAKEAAERAVLDYSVSQGKTTNTSGNVAALEEEVRYLRGGLEALTDHVAALKREVKILQNEIDVLNSNVAVLSK